MTLQEWKIQYDETIKILDSLDFPLPEQEEDLYHYRDRIEEQFKDIDLPPAFEGELFNFIGIEEFADYLREHRNMYIREDIKYTVWRN